MSLSENSAARLLDTHRERLLAERETALIANRVKLLQQEEARLKKQTEHRLKESQRLEAIKHRNEERNMEKARIQAERNRRVQEAKQIIGLLKDKHAQEHGRMQKAVWKIRQDAGREGREMRTMSLQLRQNQQQMTRLENLKKSEAVRLDKVGKSQRLEGLRHSKLGYYHEDYLRRVSDEQGKLNDARKTIDQLEALEARLIEKLKDSVDRSKTVRSLLVDKSSPSV